MSILNKAIIISLQKMYGFEGLEQIEVRFGQWTMAGQTTNQTRKKDKATQPIDYGELRRAINIIETFRKGSRKKTFSFGIARIT